MKKLSHNIKHSPFNVICHQFIYFLNICPVYHSGAQGSTHNIPSFIFFPGSKLGWERETASKSPGLPWLRVNLNLGLSLVPVQLLNYYTTELLFVPFIILHRRNKQHSQCKTIIVRNSDIRNGNVQGSQSMNLKQLSLSKEFWI